MPGRKYKKGRYLSFSRNQPLNLALSITPHTPYAEFGIMVTFTHAHLDGFAAILVRCAGFRTRHQGFFYFTTIRLNGNT